MVFWNDMESLPIIIENPKGTYKSFQTEGDPVWEKYPLKGMTYPVDYGSIEGYVGEDGADLDIFVGTGDLSGYIKVSRMDVPEETKFFTHVSDEEIESIKKAFQPVLLDTKVLMEAEFERAISRFKTK